MPHGLYSLAPLHLPSLSRPLSPELGELHNQASLLLLLADKAPEAEGHARTALDLTQVSGWGVRGEGGMCDGCGAAGVMSDSWGRRRTRRVCWVRSQSTCLLLGSIDTADSSWRVCCRLH